MTGGLLSAEDGYTAAPQAALRLWPTQGHTNWNAADPPRVWDMIRHEDDKLGWEQVKGLRTLAGLLMAQADSLTRRREALAQMWPAAQSTAAAEALGRLDNLIKGMRADSECALQNALAIEGIMTATAEAKKQVLHFVQQWETTTNEGGPEWWDRNAARLSYLTEQTMESTERAIRDHRARVTMPKEWRGVGDYGPAEPNPIPQPKTPRDDQTRPVPMRTPLPAPPPLPGRPPLMTPPPSDSGPDLQSINPVPALPGQPVSMLPISPGNPLAPYGGAYVLPGPGVGRSGYVVALPQPGSGQAPSVSMPRGGAAGGAPGLMPMPMGGPIGAPGNRDGNPSYRRSPDTRWAVTHGVPPVIKPESPAHAAETSPEQIEEDFRQWFTHTAMPWRLEETPNTPAPIVTIRRGANPL